ncbi:hypothetical protein OI978_16870 [Serratia nevei]|nr:MULTISPECIES: hypothetical protein [Serratia]MDM1790113.1 hypothetical protein [Serratia marcescens]MDM1793168.1 hypothetical protein [Serratia marcescens]MDM1799905.1 hypothetical protein [Serratia marcescens]MDM1805435.1 hypothetical protein [Serratia marcescens]MDM1812951.1 hypothetical protein [Serratia marcescens]
MAHVFSGDKTKAFYLNFLGDTLECEHRFSKENIPSRDNLY